MTINLPDWLAKAAMVKAAAQHRTFTSLVEEGLRMVLDRTVAAATREPLPSYGERGARFLVDLTDREALWEALDADGRR